MSSPASLRDLYAPPSNAWAFNAATPNASAPDVPSAASSSHQWSTRTSPNPLFGLSSSITNREDEPGLDVSIVLQGLLASALLQYATTAVSIPWEVGKTLLQVQWVPRNADELLPGIPPAPEPDIEDGVSPSHT